MCWRWDDLVLIGDATDLRRALERRKSSVPPAGSLRERLGAHPDTTFALVMDSAKGRLSSAHVTVALATNARAKGRFAFNETFHHKSLFTATGQVNPKTQMLRRSPTLFVSDEFE